MAPAFLFGALTAWALAQVALGVFFTLAHALGKREPEYRLFGLLCFMTAVSTAATGFSYVLQSEQQWQVTAALGHAGGVAATALNLHFVVRYAGVRRVRLVAAVSYALVAAYGLLLIAGAWWQPGSIVSRPYDVFGATLQHVSATPTPLAASFYALAFIALATSFWLLFEAYRRGKREALWSLIGLSAVMGAGINDMLFVTGAIDATIYLVPHAILPYAFAVGSTLLFRYSTTAGQLEQVATSLRQRTEELRHSHQEIRLMQDELVRKKQLAAVGELSAAIAHEVRNPLAIIVNAVAGLRRTHTGEQDRQMLLDIVDEETARLNRLVTDLLRFARPVNVKRSVVSLVELAERARSIARSGCEVKIESIPDAKLTNIAADPGLLRLVFDNLVSNACQAMPEGGAVQMRVRQAEIGGRPAVAVDVDDTGHGMDDVVLRRATDPFFTTRPSGTGLGLPIVERIMEAHGGRLEIDSEQGRGTRVTLVFPLVDAVGEELGSAVGVAS